MKAATEQSLTASSARVTIFFNFSVSYFISSVAQSKDSYSLLLSFQVDLGATHALNEIRIFNSWFTDRAATLQILVSENVAVWEHPNAASVSEKKYLGNSKRQTGRKTTDTGKEATRRREKKRNRECYCSEKQERKMKAAHERRSQRNTLYRLTREKKKWKVKRKEQQLQMKRNGDVTEALAIPVSLSLFLFSTSLQEHFVASFSLSFISSYSELSGLVSTFPCSYFCRFVPPCFFFLVFLPGRLLDGGLFSRRPSAWCTCWSMRARSFTLQLCCAFCSSPTQNRAAFTRRRSGNLRTADSTRALDQ